MGEFNFKYIHFVKFSQLHNWSVQYAVKHKMNFTHKYPMARIESFLSRNTDRIEVEDDIFYKRITVKTNNGGVCLRDEVKGSSIGTKKQTIVKEGQFIVSKIDARNGAFGIIPEELNGAIVTQDFPVFDVDNSKVLTQFLVLVSTTPTFIEFAKSCSSGTTNRKRMDVEEFLATSIPLPGLNVQKQILSQYNKLFNEAYAKDLKASKTNDYINDYLHTILKFDIKKSQLHPGLNFISFKDLTRWDVLYYSSNMKVLSKFDTISLKQCISHFMVDDNGISLRINSSDTPSKEFHYIGMECIEKNTGSLLKLNIVHGDEIKSQTNRVPKNFIIYGKLRPYLNKYWVNKEISDAICSSEFFVFNLRNEIDLRYFMSILQSYIVQEQISESSSGARMPRISKETFLNIKIPIPPLEIQKIISKKVEGMRYQERKLKEEANKDKQTILAQFENTIFENTLND